MRVILDVIGYESRVDERERHWVSVFCLNKNARGVGYIGISYKVNLATASAVADVLKKYGMAVYEGVMGTSAYREVVTHSIETLEFKSLLEPNKVFDLPSRSVSSDTSKGGK